MISSGRLLKRLGDGLLVVFERGDNAVQAAVAMLRRLDEPGCTFEGGRRPHPRRAQLRTGRRQRGGRPRRRRERRRRSGASLASADEILLSGELLKELPEAMRESRARSIASRSAIAPEAVAVHRYLSRARGRDDPARRVCPRAALQARDRGAATSGLPAGRTGRASRCGRSAENDVTIDKLWSCRGATPRSRFAAIASS